ncbi:hypothetical protein C0J45_5251 [Silurus meridionalis]|nr:hypothetical protein C0J45_5251 [Silurus meridionalis]
MCEIAATSCHRHHFLSSPPFPVIPIAATSCHRRHFLTSPSPSLPVIAFAVTSCHRLRRHFLSSPSPPLPVIAIAATSCHCRHFLSSLTFQQHDMDSFAFYVQLQEFLLKGDNPDNSTYRGSE